MNTVFRDCGLPVWLVIPGPPVIPAQAGIHAVGGLLDTCLRRYDKGLRRYDKGFRRYDKGFRRYDKANRSV